MNFYALANAWWFALLVPLIVFYFLKLRRPRQEVSSLALWRQVLSDQRVNSPFQKFKRNILLLLQIALLTLLVLAVMQPVLSGGAERVNRLPILIDTSASMAALEGPGGRTRLDEARAAVEELIDDLPSGQEVSLIAFHSTARRLTEFTDNKRVLREALAQLEVSDVPGDLTEALRMTEGLARTVSAETPIEKVLLVSDGNLPRNIEFALPFDVEFHKLKAGGTNVGVTALGAARAGESGWEVFVRIEGTPAAEGGVTVKIVQDGEPVGEERVFLTPGESRRVAFRVDGSTATDIELRIEPDAFDSLAADNVGWLPLPAARPLTAYVPADLAAYRHALSALEGLQLYPSADGGEPPGEYDLAIVDQSVDLPEGEREARVTLGVGFVPDELSTLVSIAEGSAEVVTWDRADPLLQHVLLSDVQIAEVPTVVEAAGAADFEDLGWEVLADGGSGPLALKKRMETRLRYQLLFHTDRSTLPYRVGFPILVANLVEIARHNSRLGEIRGAQSGVLPPRELQADTLYEVAGPGGFVAEVRSRRDGTLSGVPAPRVGRYVISAGGSEAARVGVSLLDTRETSLLAVDEIQFDDLSIEATGTEIEHERPLWPLLALAGFAVLLVEWWFFQRRPGQAPA